jgi:hypothetical protein
MADATLEAEIVPDTSAVEQVQNEELELGGGGDLSSSQKSERENVISGGFRTALAATGIIGLLANLKPLTATIGAIFGLIGRSLVPVIELIAELLRPLENLVNRIGQFTESVTPTPTDEREEVSPEQVEGILGNVDISDPASVLRANNRLSELRVNPNADNQGRGGGEAVNEQLASVVGTLAESQSNGKPDLSGEASKIDKKEEIQAASQDIVGAFQE